MVKKHLIVFDIDGTLTDSVNHHQHSFKMALNQMGVTRFNSNFKEYKHHTDSYIAKVIYENDSQEKFSKLRVEEFEEYLTKDLMNVSIKEIDGAKKTINHLELETEFAVCYATGSLFSPAKFKLNSIGINFSPEILVASNEMYDRESIVSKAIENASKHYGVNKFDRIISVGDGLWDLKTANNLNIEFIGVGRTNKKVLLENGMINYFETLKKFRINE